MAKNLAAEVTDKNIIFDILYLGGLLSYETDSVEKAIRKYDSCLLIATEIFSWEKIAKASFNPKRDS